MTTSTFTSPVDSDTDTDFRAWGSQISAQLQAVGLVQTADTGQIDWTTVSISGYPGSVGYEIYEFSASDPFQAGTPVVFKLEYGAASAEAPEMWLTVGASSDGAGNITGTYKTNRVNFMGSANPTFNSAFPSYICHKPASGFLGVALKIGSYGSNTGYAFFITRTNDTSGAATGDGWNLYVTNASNPQGQIQGYFQNPSYPTQFPISGTVSGNPSIAVWPYDLTSSYAGGSLQAVTVYALQPAVQTNAQLCAAVLTEIPVGNQFALNVVGLTPRNFISVGVTGPFIANGYQYTNCMIWE
jgi:hypothetical protein